MKLKQSDYRLMSIDTLWVKVPKRIQEQVSLDLHASGMPDKELMLLKDGITMPAERLADADRSDWHKSTKEFISAVEEVLGDADEVAFHS